MGSGSSGSQRGTGDVTGRGNDPVRPTGPMDRDVTGRGNRDDVTGRGMQGTEGQRSATKPDFQSVDTDRDGKISESEFSRVQGGDLGRVDTNRDGTIDRNEFRNMTWAQQGSGEPQRGTMGSGSRSGSSSSRTPASRDDD
jgi:hypothetical protein